MTRKVRVHEIAQQLQLTSDEVIEKLRARGEAVTSASSTVHEAVADVLIAIVRSQDRRAAPPMVRRRPTPVAVPIAATDLPAASAEPPAEPAIELLDIKTRFERELAVARARGQNPRSPRSEAMKR